MNRAIIFLTAFTLLISGAPAFAASITKETDCVKYAEEVRTRNMIVGGVIGGMLGSVLGAGDKTGKTVGGAAAGAAAGWMMAQDALRECQTKKDAMAKADPASQKKIAGDMKMDIINKEERLLKMERRIAEIKGDQQQVAMLDKRQAELANEKRQVADANMSISKGPTMYDLRKKEQQKEDQYYRDLKEKMDKSS